MRGAGLFLCLIGFAASQQGQPRQLPGTPRFEVHQSKSFRGIPFIDVTFANGVQDSLVLERFYPTKQSQMERKLSCNFFGHLRDEETACVSVTGCPGDEMSFMINSKNSGARGMFILHKDGTVEVVESVFKDERVKSEKLRVPGSKYDRKDPLFVLGGGGDELINPDEIADEMKYEKLCASGDCSSMPAKQRMQIKIHYDDTFDAATSDVTGYLDSMVTHLQTHFCQTSLGTQIRLEVIGSYTYQDGQSWKADSDILGGSVKDIAAADSSGADLNVFMCKDTSFIGTVGIAWVGTMCRTYWPGYNAGINEKRSNELSTSEVVAHEMGHNMGMLHDFDAEHGGDNGACDGKGIMSYGSFPNVWSTCSKNDFKALYDSIISGSVSWCLDVDNSACGGDGTTPTAGPPAPTTAPPCGSPQWANDQWCDDENNNVECEWDGGACCNNDFEEWSTYCTECECLDPNNGDGTNTTTVAPTTTTEAPTTTTVAPSTAQPTTQGPTTEPGTCADMPTFMINSDRIVGGEATSKPIPWQAALLNGNSQFCGATVLDASTLLCAAHCSPNTGHSIRVGSINRKCGGQTRNIAQVIYNTNEGYQYNSATFDNDFVILKLDSPLALNDDVKPACLPSSSSYLDVSSTEDRCFTSGWGTLSSGGDSTDKLRYVRVPAITNAACNDDYGDSITDSMICAGYPGIGGKDACQGDSGGPFVCNDGGKAVIAGVVSWGNGCALADYSGVYARTTHVLDWIKENMGSSGTVPTEGPPGNTAVCPPEDGCGSPQWAGDQWCDDENNNEGCNWDGGACCFNNATGWDDYCTDCSCKECVPEGWHGDGYCDDGDLNTENCKYDGGDCCGDDVQTNFCTECQCLDPSGGGNTTTSTTTTTTISPTTTTTNNTLTGCGTPDWATDQWCDDENNNVDCNFDGGACCFNDFSGWDTYCDDCECEECKPWHGDGYCDDNLNTANCIYDGKDCCGDDVDTSFCENCQCLDPNYLPIMGTVG